jgi:hypothetical protein
VELDDDYGYYLIEISQTKNYLFFVAYDVQNITNFAKKYVKKMSLAKGLKLLEQFGFNLDKISKCIRINKKDQKLYLVIERNWMESSSNDFFNHRSSDLFNNTSTSFQANPNPRSPKSSTSLYSKKLNEFPGLEQHQIRELDQEYMHDPSPDGLNLKYQK